MSNLKFKPVYKDKLFFNQFNYCIRFRLNELSCVRYLSHDTIDDIISARRRWRKSLRGFRVIDKITDETVERLHEFLDVILSVKSAHKLVINYHTGYIYTNNLKVIQKFYNIGYLNHKRLTEVIVNRPLNTIKLKTPKHKFRSYFRFAKLEEKDRKAIKSLLEAQGSEVRISPSLNKYLNESLKITMDHFFIDYNDPGILIMLCLIRGNIIRKTCDIIQA